VGGAMTMLGTRDLRFALDTAQVRRRTGTVVHVVGTLVEAELPGARIGEVCHIEGAGAAETVGFKESRAVLMPFGTVDGVHYGVRITTTGEMPSVGVGEALKGRVLNGFGEPIDGGPPLDHLPRRPIHAPAPPALSRGLIRTSLETGVRVIDTMLTVGRGQRISLMSGSGVGKSTLMGMIARGSAADVNVIALIGERGREVREFLEDVLGPEGLSRSVLVVVTSDSSPVLQVRGAFLAATISDWFRDQGADVLFFMDSATRLAMAQRQIGLAAGEPPTTKGYTPSVFALLPRLMERAGLGEGSGSVTAIYTVLVDGDDIHDPIGDAVRGIVDGHVVLSRRIAAQAMYPAVDVLHSLSRVMPAVVSPEHLQVASRTRALLATWSENEELIRLGAYRAGSNAAVDEAVARVEGLWSVFRQDFRNRANMDLALQDLAQAALGPLNAPASGGAR